MRHVDNDEGTQKMNSIDTLNIIVSLFSGVMGGVVVAIVNYYLSKRKTEAEIRKLEAETEKIRVETSQIVTNLSATVGYKLADTAERIIYDGTKECDPYDFRGVEGQFWSATEKKHIGPKGLGTLTVEKGGILNVRRTNTEGRFEIWLQRYHYDGVQKTFVPKNELIAAQRQVRVSCQAKAVGGEHTLRFVLRQEQTGTWLANERIRINGNEWTPFDLYFQISPMEDWQLRIDNEDVSQAPSSVQIHHLVLAERMS
jgi:hypothetical protein